MWNQTGCVRVKLSMKERIKMINSIIYVVGLVVVVMAVINLAT